MNNEKIIEALLLFCDAQENALMILRNYLKNLGKLETHQLQSNITSETIFNNLKWRDEHGVKIGLYQIAINNQNHSANWDKAFKLLEEKQATISNRLHGEGYLFSYWIYDKMPYKIFRQILKEGTR